MAGKRVVEDRRTADILGRNSPKAALIAESDWRRRSVGHLDGLFSRKGDYLQRERNVSG